MSKSRAKGTSFETLLVNYLCQLGYDAERLVLKGGKDEGDIRVRWIAPGRREFGIEAKNVRAASLGTWVEEARAEAENAGYPVVVVHKRHGKGRAEDQFVSMRLADFLAWFAVKDPSLFGSGQSV